MRILISSHVELTCDLRQRVDYANSRNINNRPIGGVVVVKREKKLMKHLPVVEKSICTMVVRTFTEDSDTFSLKKTEKLIEIAPFQRQPFDG